jgi:MFS family permease
LARIRTLSARPIARRWLIVAALFVVTCGISTPLAAYGVFLPVLAETFGWSRGAISSAISLNLLLGGLASFPVGALADRRGPRLVLVLTVILAGAGFALVSTVERLWQLYLFVGVFGGVGMSSFYLLAAATVTRWFEERRGMALALVLVGFSLGYISGGPLAAWLIASMEWRWAYALLGGGSGLVTMLAALTVRLPRESETAALRRGAERNGGAGSGSGGPGIRAGVTLGEALVDPRQWCLNVAWLLLGAVGLMISVHIVPYARDQGISLAGASLALTAYGIGSVVGRLAAGAVSDRIGTRSTMRAGCAIQALGLVALLLVPSGEGLLGALVALGVGFAASDTMVVKAIPDVFGVRAIGGIMGVLGVGWRFGAALGPATAGFLHDVTGSYAIPFGMAPLAVLVSWTLFTVATARRVKQALPH